MADWFQTAFKDFGEFPAWAWIVVAVLLVGGVIAYRQSQGRSQDRLEHEDDGHGCGLHCAEQRAEHD